MVDVVIVGGGTAGLSAALLLGRCGRRVLVCDAGRPRNRFARRMHGFLSRDGIAPAEFLSVARRQAAAYAGVSFEPGTVLRASGRCGDFTVHLENGAVHHTRRILLAMGIIDELPAVTGIEAFYGTSVHHCPYCDGWEHWDRPLAVLGSGAPGVDLAREMRGWSTDVILCTDGRPLGDDERRRLEEWSVGADARPIERLEGAQGQLRGLRFRDGGFLAREALFFSSRQRPPGDLPLQLGCQLDEAQFVVCDENACTSVCGVYAAGNTATGLQLAIIAAAEGAKAAWAINQDLLSPETPPALASTNSLKRARS